MDRPIVYLGQVPRSLDVLSLGQDAMVGIGKLAEAVLGNGTFIAGFNCTGVSPASMNINVGAGQVYEVENLEASTVSGLAPDTHSIVKQGINLDPATFTLVAPATIGLAVNVLVEVQYADADTGNTLLTFQNPSSPGQTFQGPGGNGQQSTTVRKGVAQVQLKYGTAATSGSQATPAPDSGFVGIAVVTLGYGQTTITSSNIAPYFAAPVIPVTLPGVPAGVQSGAWIYADDTGTADALAIALSPTPASIGKGFSVNVKKGASDNATTSPTISVLTTTGLQTFSIIKSAGGALAPSDMPAGAELDLICDGANFRLAGMTPSDVSTLIAAGLSEVPSFWVNPFFEVCQAGASWTCGANVDTHIADWWDIYCTGADVNASQTARLSGAKGNSSITINGASGNTSVNLKQKIRQVNLATIAGLRTFSWRIFNNTGAPLTPNVEVYICNTANSFSNNYSNVTKRASVPMRTIAAGTTMTVSGTIDISTLTNWQNGFLVQLNFATGLPSGGSVVIADAQNCAGAVPMPIASRGPTVEYMRCTARYQSWGGIYAWAYPTGVLTNPFRGIGNGTGNGTYIDFVVRYWSQMEALPTMSYSGLVVDQTATMGTLTFIDSDYIGGTLRVSGVTNTNAGSYKLRCNNSASDYIIFDARP